MATECPTLWWIRRDLRLADNPALQVAIDAGSSVLPLFILDPALLATAGHARSGWLYAALRVLDTHLRTGGGPGLSVLTGRPEEVVPRVAQRVKASSVHVSADFAPYGGRRDRRVESALSGIGIELLRTGSPYAVAPGTLLTKTGTPYQVFTPFHRAWADRGVHAPAPGVSVDRVDWIADADREALPEADPELMARAGEEVAQQQWRAWLEAESHGVDDYDQLNDFPGADATSHLSIALRWGHLHPRTLLADLDQHSAGAAALARQLAWRDFFADVLFHRPDAVSQPIRHEFAALPTDEPDPITQRGRLASERLQAWQQGQTGFPLVDAGMRQLLAEGWMHNRVRMVVASFLIKDLHLGWWHGARWFMERLHDGDIAQNQLNWQWVAGCGTDASPYVRVFNPTTQSIKFDSDGTYIRRYVPELIKVANRYVHEPWADPDGVPAGYPAPIVDHTEERLDALERYEFVKRAR